MTETGGPAGVPAAEPVAEPTVEPTVEPAGELPGAGSGRGAFHVRLENFEGPFDLLLGLIAKHRLDVTEVALSQVTDEFIAHIRAMGDGWDLGQATEFLVVASTLLDLKAARLLPSGDVEDEEDLALLEARDLLFARLLQYRAYKQVAAWLADRITHQGRRYPRTVSLEPRFAAALPEVLLGLGPDEFAALASRVFAPRQAPVVSVEHVHAPQVSVREHAAVVAERLRRTGSASFRSLCHDCTMTLEIVARFLAVLELYREALVTFDQLAPLGELTIRWSGQGDAGDGAEPRWSDSWGGDWDDPADEPAAAGPRDSEDEGT